MLFKLGSGNGPCVAPLTAPRIHGPASRLSLFAAVLLWSLASSTASRATEFVCETLESLEASSITAVDSVRALLVFVEFSDQATDTPQCPTDPWPPGQQLVPSWGEKLLESSTPPSEDASLTQFYYLQSDSKHLLVGDVYDSVVVAPNTITHYSTNGGTGQACKDVLEAIDPWVNFSNYDADSDNFVDFVFVAFRVVKNGTHALHSGIFGTQSLGEWSPITVDGDTLSPFNGARFGADTRRSHHWFFEIAAHEYGHVLLRTIPQSKHIPSNHIWSGGPYELMDGTDSGSPFGHYFSALVRKELGWITPIEVSFSSPGIDTVVLKDVGTNAGLGCAVVKTSAMDWQYFLLECRDSTATAFTNGEWPDGCNFPKGYSGLLVSHINTRGAKAGALRTGVGGWYQPNGEDWLCPTPGCEEPPGRCDNENYPPTLDIEVATGLFDADGGTAAPDPVQGHDALSWDEALGLAQRSDLYRAQAPSSNAFTPYTNPNTNWYWDAALPAYDDTSHCASGIRQDQTVYSGLSFYNIRWSTAPGNGNGEIEVIIRYDGSNAPADADTLFDDTTWEGLVQLVGDVVVDDEATLTIAEGTTVVAAAEQDQRTGGTDTTRVQLGINGALDVKGTTTNGVLLTSSRDNDFDNFLDGEAANAAPGDWSAIVFELEGAHVAGYGYVGCAEPLSSIKYANIRYAAYGLRIRDLCAPTLSNVSFANITADRHILLDSTDVIIPLVFDPADSERIIGSGSWDLKGRTRVVATTHGSEDTDRGTTGKVDLIPFGPLKTSLGPGQARLGVS